MICWEDQSKKSSRRWKARGERLLNPRPCSNYVARKILQWSGTLRLHGCDHLSIGLNRHRKFAAGLRYSDDCTPNLQNRIYDDERNLKLYLLESEVPRVKSYLGLRKARSEPESAVGKNNVHKSGRR